MSPRIHGFRTYDDWKLATPPEYDELGPEPPCACEAEEEEGVMEEPETGRGAANRDALIAKLRAGLVDVLRTELWRQATEGGDFYASYDIPGTDEVRDDISYEGDIDLGEMADAIIKAVETRKLLEVAFKEAITNDVD
jgi:hypothetical protein